MTQGIRNFAVAKFNELLPQRAEIGNTKFRAAVMQSTMAAFSISLASAATHYNHALKLAKANTPTLVEGLGRPDDKKGGRKPTHLFNVAVDADGGEVIAQGLSKAKAQELIDAAKAAGKVALKMVEVTPAAAPAEAAAAPEVPVAETPQPTPEDVAELTAIMEQPAQEGAAVQFLDEINASAPLNLQALEQDTPAEEQAKFDPATAEAAPF